MRGSKILGILYKKDEVQISQDFGLSVIEADCKCSEKGPNVDGCGMGIKQQIVLFEKIVLFDVDEE